jgi:hypothetical protein
MRGTSENSSSLNIHAAYRRSLSLSLITGSVLGINNFELACFSVATQYCFKWNGNLRFTCFN